MPGAPQRPVPEGFREYLLANSSNATQRHFKAMYLTFKRWCEQEDLLDFVRARQGNPIDRSGMEPLPMPDDFEHWCSRESTDALCRRCEVGPKPVRRWIADLGFKPVRNPVERRPPPPNFVAIVATMYRFQAAKHLGVGDNTLQRWAKETGAVFKPRRKFSPTQPKLFTPLADSSVAGQAARHLQSRGWSPVYRKDGGYIVGRLTMSTDDMISMAERKGFVRDEWKCLPAHLSSTSLATAERI